MEFLKHEANMFMDGEPESGIRRTANRYMSNNQIFKQEHDDVTRQRLVFAAILIDHYEVLFNGNNNERGPLWEELRQFMIELGAHTLMDKDWKYVGSCYWQNIRKESIRRMAKMRVGAVKHARPAQLELDRLVSEVLNKRGPGALETVLRNYSKNYTDEENGAVDGQQIEESPLSNSASPAVIQEEATGSQQNALDQLIRNATHQKRHTPAVAAQQSSSAAGNHSVSKTTKQQELTQPEGGNLSLQLANIVAKTHSQLLVGGYVEMAAEFEQQLKQMVNGYKAWMFDQLFQQEEVEEDAVGVQQQAAGNSEAKRSRHC